MREQEVREIYEAYMQVHQPQEEVEQLNEEAPERITTRTKNKRLMKDAGPARVHNPNKVDEEVEAWVNALVEEGYDLSEYTWDDMCEMYLDEARRADREGYERGTAANPTRAQTDVPHSDPSQRTSLHSKFRRRSDEMGRARRNSPRNRSGGRTPVSAKEKAFLQAGDRTSPGRGHVRSPNVGDTGRHSGEGRYDREDKKNPKLNPKHSANRENAAESFDLFDTILEYLVAEGYADTNEAALVIMANMSEEWKQSIVEEVFDEALTGERYKKAVKKPGGTAYSRMVSADPSKRATRGGRGGESDFGAGDRGSGNRAARRAGTYKED